MKINDSILLGVMREFSGRPEVVGNVESLRGDVGLEELEEYLERRSLRIYRPEGGVFDFRFNLSVPSESGYTEDRLYELINKFFSYEWLSYVRKVEEIGTADPIKVKVTNIITVRQPA